MEKEKIEKVKSIIRDVPDFPTKGVLFRDLTTAFKDGEVLHIISEELKDQYKNLGVTKVVGIEARGFIGASILAYELNAGFVPLRKPGKLPANTIQKSYAKEYGTDTMRAYEMFMGA
ncbi:MAG: adenine phosphoribosyltransferase, partial [Muribaculaceae bacterium]